LTAKGSGFKKEDKKNFTEYDAKVKEQGSIAIPPGSHIIFYQSILHEVIGGKGKNKVESIRLFSGFHLGIGRKELFPLKNVWRNQGVPLIPSGQRAAMFSSFHDSALIATTSKWSIKTFKRRCLIERHTPKFDGLVVSRYMHSLRHYHLRRYEGYHSYEKRIFRPHKTFVFPDANGKKHTVRLYD
jgi:hypothetical protein